MLSFDKTMNSVKSELIFLMLLNVMLIKSFTIINRGYHCRSFIVQGKCKAKTV